MNFKKLLITFSFVMCMLSLTVHAKTMQFTMGDANVKVDAGQIEAYEMEVAPYTVSGRTMVPVRIVAEKFGADVQYVHEESKVIITLGDKKISMIIGEAVADVNGETVALDVPTVETNGRTLVPLRFVSETLGFDVKYMQTTQQILITNDPAVIEFNNTKVFLSEFEAMCKLICAEYGVGMSEQVVDYTLAIMSENSFFDAEAEKWGMSAIDPLFYTSITSNAKEVSAYFDDVLDASWVSLFESTHKRSFMITFLELLYEGDEETLAEYEKTAFDGYMAAQHILISDKAVAESVLKQIKGGADFDELMNSYSEDPGLTQADYYVFTDGEMVEEFETATKKLKVGQVSNLVKSEYGYHIIKRIDIPAEYIKMMYTDEKVNQHIDSAIEEGTVVVDNYTSAELVELCK